VVNDAMDIQAGAAICRGPRNTLSRAYAAIPIAITVEGANILTRSLIIYGQGAIRAHPFVREEMDAVGAGDLARFDRAFFGHVNFACRNLMRALIGGLTLGRLNRAPVAGPTAVYFRHLSRFAMAFALISDVALAVYGGDLKRREKISGRLADALAWLYLGSATLKRFHDEGAPDRDLAVMRWAAELALCNIETALRGVLGNLPVRLLGRSLELLVFGVARRQDGPSDRLGAALARGVLDDGALRRHLTGDIYVPSGPEAGLGDLEATLKKVVAARPVIAKLSRHMRNGPKGGDLDTAVETGLITCQERQCLMEADAAREAAIQVDVFDPETYHALKG